jgi:endonuclease YncB( thermonuclease family)
MSLTIKIRKEDGMEKLITLAMRRTPHLVAFALFLCFLGAVQDFTGKVVGVTDGDTLTVLHDNKPEKIRLNGIDCPESGQPFGTKAKQFTSDLTFGKIVTVQVRDRDRYGRTVAEIILPDGRSLNREIVKAGFAWWYQKYAPGDANLKAFEAEARQERRGLWQDANPIPPWEWRAKGKATQSPKPEASGGEWCASRNSQVYHPCSCPSVSRIKPENLIKFKIEKEAQESGRRHCKCR